MPLYDYRCQRCNLVFEVSRTFAESDTPADCPLCKIPTKREISAPLTTFTRGAAAEALRRPPGGFSDPAASHGHSHSHAHDDGHSHSH